MKHSLNKYQKLADDSPVPADSKAFLNGEDDIAFVHHFLSKMFTPRETIVKSSWEGHVPFLYCLLHYFRPRRFVELGTYYGNSFFAACQMSKMMDNFIECIAVDSWVGDKHAGMLDKKVHDQFVHILEHRYPRAKHIRKLFSEAAGLFEKKSIDMLHIDGLHTYEAVFEDFQTWLPMMSDRGIILFHDTHEKTDDFGVWKLWDELKTTYPYFEFSHCHGLGVILVGNNPPDYVIRLFELFSREEYKKFFAFIFSQLATVQKPDVQETNSLNIIYGSYTWRIGRAITWLPRKIMNLGS